MTWLLVVVACLTVACKAQQPIAVPQADSGAIEPAADVSVDADDTQGVIAPIDATATDATADGQDSLVADSLAPKPPKQWPTPKNLKGIYHWGGVVADCGGIPDTVFDCQGLADGTPCAAMCNTKGACEAGQCVGQGQVIVPWDIELPDQVEFSGTTWYSWSPQVLRVAADDSIVLRYPVNDLGDVILLRLAATGAILMKSKSTEKGLHLLTADGSTVQTSGDAACAMIFKEGGIGKDLSGFVSTLARVSLVDGKVTSTPTAKTLPGYVVAADCDHLYGKIPTSTTFAYQTYVASSSGDYVAIALPGQVTPLVPAIMFPRAEGGYYWSYPAHFFDGTDVTWSGAADASGKVVWQKPGPIFYDGYSALGIVEGHGWGGQKYRYTANGTLLAATEETAYCKTLPTCVNMEWRNGGPGCGYIRAYSHGPRAGLLFVDDAWSSGYFRFYGTSGGHFAGLNSVGLSDGSAVLVYADFDKGRYHVARVDPWGRSSCKVDYCAGMISASDGCDDGDPATVDYCIQEQGCQHEKITSKP